MIEPTTAPLATVGCQPTKERADDDVIYLGTYKGHRKSHHKKVSTASTLRIPADMTYKHVKLGVAKDFAQTRRAVYGFFDRAGRLRRRMDSGQRTGTADQGPCLSAALILMACEAAAAMSSRKECDELIDTLDTLPLLIKRVKALLDHSQHPSIHSSLVSDSQVDDAIFYSLSRVEAEVKLLDETIKQHLSCLGPDTGKPVAAQAGVLSVRLPPTSSTVTGGEEACNVPLNSTLPAEHNASLTRNDRITVRECRADLVPSFGVRRGFEKRELPGLSHGIVEMPKRLLALTPPSRNVCFVDLTIEHSPKYGPDLNTASDVGSDCNPGSDTDPKPNRKPSSKSIAKLIARAVEHAHVGWLSCRDQAQFRQRLGQFCPGRYVDDVVFLAMLQLVCCTSTLQIIDPLLVSFMGPFLTSGAFAFAKGFDGIVLPINVNAADHMSDHNRNHWILAIVNWKTETFDAFGMQPTAFCRWSKRVDEYISELRGAVMQLEKRSHELGPYFDDSCCAFLCAYALERYMGRAPQRQERWPTGLALRKHYLRRLLAQWELPAGHLPEGPQHSASGGGPRFG
ncbi:hypothetical protein CORC01_14473 [Colletotrichum orchidophilum]|uniref:Uncharacterized protein n=1 Tax=Colletotrichum orchidophilum TaxID=1209926 RepID=A0A1G4AM76_9PEZI|nr:uncharacterized protein CORC01_14473 [Colletotrichum orchidophilum]OHE90231.1 hypothetical protein CORC01_14473 [Colletotrichum orchidophilum]